MHRHTYLFGAVVLALALVGSASGAGVFAVDGNHALGTESAVAEFQSEDVVSANLTSIDMGVTIAESHNLAGMDGVYRDANRLFVCLDYRESIPRTVRIHIPEDYFTPRTATTESLNSAHVAELQPAPNGTATAITVEFDSAGEACIPISKAAGFYIGVRSGIDDFLGNTTGYEPPSPTSDADEQWRRLPSAAFQNDTTYAINTSGHETTIQYDAAVGPSESWIAVPDCENPADQAVCRYATRGTGENTTVILMSTQPTPPDVRYKLANDRSAGVLAGARDAWRALESAASDVSSLFGGD